MLRKIIRVDPRARGDLHAPEAITNTQMHIKAM
jgi:hypothetical protein